MISKAKQTVVVLGVTLARYKDCPLCGAKLVCEWNKYAYQLHENCPKAKKQEPLAWKHGNPLKNREISGVFEGKGTRFFTNHKGDVLRTEPLNRPIPAGRKDWK